MVGHTAGLHKGGGEAKMVASPNPGNGIFHLSMPGRFLNACNVSVTDVMGNAVYNAQSNPSPAVKIDLSSRPKGIYFVKLTEGGKVSVNKVVIQ